MAARVAISSTPRNRLPNEGRRLIIETGCAAVTRVIGAPGGILLASGGWPLAPSNIESGFSVPFTFSRRLGAYHVSVALCTGGPASAREASCCAPTEAPEGTGR